MPALVSVLHHVDAKVHERAERVVDKRALDAEARHFFSHRVNLRMTGVREGHRDVRIRDDLEDLAHLGLELAVLA